MGAKDRMFPARLQGHAKRLLDMGGGLGQRVGGNGEMVEFHGEAPWLDRSGPGRQPSKSGGEGNPHCAGRKGMAVLLFCA
ncbi:hypothetical protein GCM10007921_10020 [Tritonibacter mobilis]|nr:hypothetical protein GCM10007921_10020 [Tritonibacter mobilis]